MFGGAPFGTAPFGEAEASDGSSISFATITVAATVPEWNASIVTEFPTITVAASVPTFTASVFTSYPTASVAAAVPAFTTIFGIVFPNISAAATVPAWLWRITNQDGFAYIVENVGVIAADGKQDGFAYIIENVGDLSDVEGGDPGARDAFAYILENVDAAEIPTPHIWYVTPFAGRGEQAVKIVGFGFGATQVTQDGEVVFVDADAVEWLPTPDSWTQVGVAEDVDAADRLIDELEDRATPEHQEIVFAIPAGAAVGDATISVRTETP